MTGLAFYEEDQFIGFALVVLYSAFVYLYYLAIDPDKRSSGYGAKALKALEDEYPDSAIVFEMEAEDPDRPNAKQEYVSICEMDLIFPAGIFITIKY